MKITELFSKLVEGESITFALEGHDALEVKIVKNTPDKRLSVVRCVSFSEIQAARFDVLEYEIDGALVLIRESADATTEPKDVSSQF